MPKFVTTWYIEIHDVLLVGRISSLGNIWVKCVYVFTQVGVDLP